ncbi:MAG: S8 family serine peptidase [Terricaulis sp.]
MERLAESAKCILAGLIVLAMAPACTRVPSDTSGAPQETAADASYQHLDLSEFQALQGPLEPLEPIIAPETEASQSARQVIVKFREGSGVRLRGSFVVPETSRFDAPRLVREGFSFDAVEVDLTRVNAMFGRTDVRFTRAIAPGELSENEALSEALLDRRRYEAQANSHLELPDLNLFYVLNFPASATTAAINAFLEGLRQAPSIEQAYIAPLLLNARDIAPPTTINLQSRQRYLEPAPYGIDVAFARGVPGGRGEQVSIVDIEFSWAPNHEDLPGASRLLVNFGPSNVVKDRNHGTAVFGILVGEENEFGVTGIAPLARFGFVSPQFDRTYNVGAAMWIASSYLQPGDIIVLEQQLIWPNAPACPSNHTQSCEHYGALPVETDPLTYAAIAQLVALGYVVVEAAGNGEQQVTLSDDPGAIMVGAGVPGRRAPEWFTNYGPRIDVQGWGSGIATLGYGEHNLRANAGDEQQWYTDDFGGTSGALPIVAGAAALIQSNRRAQGLRPLTSRQMRDLFVSTGVPQAPSSRNIGRQPNLRAAIPASNAIRP